MRAGRGRVAGARLALVLFIMLAWATCFVVIKAFLGGTTPLFFAALRALPAGAALLLTAQLTHQPAPSGAVWGWILLLGITNVALGFGGMFLGTDRLAPGFAAVLNNSQPLMAVALAIPVLHERPSAANVGGLLLGFAGVVVMTAPALARPSASSAGPWLILSSAFGLAVATVIVKHVSRRADVLAVSAWQFVLGGLILLVAAAATENLGATTWTPTFLIGLGYLSFIGTALTFLLWFLLIREGEVSRLTAYNFLVPVFGLALGILLYREGVGWAEAIGILLTVGGVVLVSLPRPPGPRDGSCDPRTSEAPGESGR